MDKYKKNTENQTLNYCFWTAKYYFKKDKYFPL